jgi:hypothetical protein
MRHWLYLICVLIYQLLSYIIFGVVRREWVHWWQFCVSAFDCNLETKNLGIVTKWAEKEDNGSYRVTRSISYRQGCTHSWRWIPEVARTMLRLCASASRDKYTLTSAAPAVLHIIRVEKYFPWRPPEQSRDPPYIPGNFSPNAKSKLEKNIYILSLFMMNAVHGGTVQSIYC